MVRVASLHQAISDGNASLDSSGMTPAQQLVAVARRSHEFVASLYDLATRDLFPALARHHIKIVPYEQFSRIARLSAGFSMTRSCQS